MKRLFAAALALALAFSMVGCAEKTDGETEADDIAAISPKDSSISDPVSDPASVPDDGSGKDGGSDSYEKLTPATTPWQDFLKNGYEDYTFTSQAQDYDSKTMMHRYYSGEIREDAVKKEIFEKLGSVFSGEEITLSGKQDIRFGSVILFMESESGGQYCLRKGILVDDPMQEGGPEIYVFKAPHSLSYFKKTDPEECEELEKLIEKGVKTERNLKKNIDESKLVFTDPVFPLTYISVRSNFAWGCHVGGSFVDGKGMYFRFDLSDEIEKTGSSSFADSIYDLLREGKGKITCSGVYLDKDLITKGLGYAEKIGEDTKFTEEGTMCDYGQDTLYAVIGGKLVMLHSYGDTTKTSEDENVQGAIKCFKEACEKLTEYKYTED